MKKVFLGLLTVLMVCSCGEKKESGVKMSTRVKTQLVSPAFADGAQTYVGIIEEREGTAISFTGMGVVRRVLVSEGQAVSRGQLIAEMDDTQARNLLNGAEAQMTQANDALERYKMLHDNGSLPEVQWVEIQSKGIVGKKLVGAGETAMPSQAVVTILDISSVKVKVAVPEAEISGINASTPSTISVEAAQATVKGGHIEKGIQADALTHTYDIRISVPNGDRKLLPGMVASVRFIAEGSQSISGKSLPVTAVQKAADGSLFVWTVANDSTAHRSKVSIGETHGNHVAITDGIDMGQRVVTEGYQKLSEGTKVVY